MLIGNPQMVAVDGLECSICYRVCPFGSKDCKQMPCNTFNDFLVADGEITKIQTETLKEAEDSREGLDLRSMGNKVDKLGNVNRNNPSSVNDQRFVCSKVLAAFVGGGQRLEYTHSFCSEFDADVPPRAEPYTKLPESWASYFGPALDFDKMYVCDESNQASCQVSQEELVRSKVSGSGSVSGTASKEPNRSGAVSAIEVTGTFAMVIWSCLLATLRHLVY